MKKRQQITIEIAKALAVSKHGECLSDTYVNAKSHLEWRCAKGHSWSASYDNIFHGKWCPNCAGRIIELEDMKELASRNGGRSLAKGFNSVQDKYQWKCAEDHVFTHRRISVT